MIVRPQKVNLTFDTVPAAARLYLDGIAKTTPFVYDTLVGFNHTIEARNQTAGSTSYTFGSWSDGGGRSTRSRSPSNAQSYTATFNSTPLPPGWSAPGASTKGAARPWPTPRGAATTGSSPAPA